MKQLKTAQKELNQANQQLVDLNTALQSSNLALNETNNNLKETNMVKEIYIVGTWTNVQNILLSLKGIEKLNVMATAGKMNQLLEAVQSKSLLNKN
jgi:hypothetical protein